MSRKAKHRNAQVLNKRTVIETADLPTRAATAMAAARFKDAIEHYKTLIKQDRRPEWLDALAAAYAGRAGALANKNMLPEALALWRTRAEICGRPVHEGPYAEWLVQAGDAQRAFGLLAEPKLSAELRTHIEARLAAGALTAPDDALAHVPADSSLLRHRPAALAAMATLAQGGMAELDVQLQLIPFRSPYRDLRPLLKALVSIATGQTEAAAALLARLPVDSPFEALAAVARTALLPANEWLAALPGFAPEAQQLLLDLAGCPAENRPLAIELARLGDAPQIGPLLDLLLRHCRRLRPETVMNVRRLLRRLTPHLPEKLQVIRSAFGPLSRNEEKRIKALAAQLQGHRTAAEDRWLEFVDSCDLDSADGQRMAALALRRIADGHHHPDEPGGLCEDALGWIDRSVELDPEDRVSHVRLIRAVRERGDLKRTRGHLDTALAHFPNDPEVLLEAVEVALAGNSFKKAAGLARCVLELDPINPRVRGIVGQAHLAHARKQLLAGKAEAARKELDEAAEWLRDAQTRATIAVLRGLAENDSARTDTLLREALAELDAPPLVGGFLLTLEAARVRRMDKRALRAMLKRVGIAPDRQLAPDEVLALIHALDTMVRPVAGQAPRAALQLTVEVFRDALARSVTARYSEADRRLVCETLLRHDIRTLAAQHAEAALKSWPRNLTFILLRSEARWGDCPAQIPYDEYIALEDASERAHNEGDPRTAARIDALLAPPGRLDDGRLGFADPDDMTPSDTRSLFEALLAMQGAKGFIEIVRKQLGTDMVDNLRREIGGDDARLARRMIDMIVANGPTPAAPARPTPPARPTRPLDDRQRNLFDD